MAGPPIIVAQYIANNKPKDKRMSISSTTVIMGRIKVATPESAIAVFTGKNGRLNAVFANTLETISKINDGAPGLIGIFHKEMDMVGVKTKLINEAY